MNLAHLHLLLNHVPTVGFAVGVGIFALALYRQSDHLRRAGLEMIYIIALVAIPAYLTGNASLFQLQARGTVLQDDMVAAHQDAAMLALVVMEITGAVAWIALWRFRRWTVPVLLVLSAVAFALMARAASIGGEIRHPEIQYEEGAPMPASWLPKAAAIGAGWIVDNPWVWPIAEIFHFVGLCLLFGVVLAVSLRVLGFIKGVSLRDIRGLLPWGMLGLGINIVTGMLFFLASPDQYTQNPSFAVKMALTLAGGVMLLYPTLDETDSGGRASLEARIVAVFSVLVWIGVLFFGRFLPYLGSE